MPRRPRPSLPGQLAFGFSSNESPREVERVFLGWDKPLLPLAIDRLLQHDNHKTLDLRTFIVVTPVARAGARMLESLVLRAEAAGRALLPPRLITTGSLADLLAPASLPSPHPTVRALLWAESLRSSPSTVRTAILPAPPSPDDWPGWLRLGELIDQLDAELAGGFLTFEEVIERARDLSAFPGAERWRALARVRDIFSSRLRDLHLDDPHTRRRAAIESRGLQLPAPVDKVLLLGCADLNNLMRRLLDVIRGKVTALVHAPESLASRFDRFGGVLPAAWESGPEGEVDVEVVDGPADQAAVTASVLARLAPSFGLQDVVIGVPDSDVVPTLEEVLDRVDVPTRNAAGAPMHRAAPVQLLEAVAEYLSSPTFDALANLARHPDVTRRVEVEDESRDWRTLLDRYQADHVAHRLGDRFLGHADLAESLSLRQETFKSLLGDLRGPPQPLSSWAEPIVKWLVACYGDRPLDPEDPGDRVVIAVAAEARSLLRGLHDLPPDVVGFVPAAMALRILSGALAQATIPEPPEREAIELLGWLELAHDDTPALILTGFNDGFVPKSLNADPFLPDGLRRYLGLLDNQRRFARDAFFLSAMLASRDHVTLISGRRTQGSDPLGPSRLSLCGDERVVARRVLTFYKGDKRAVPIVGGRVQAGREEAQFPLPKPRPLDRPIESLSVTAFGDYLTCPYRFYLRHVLKLRTLGDDAVELDARLFGNLAHAVLSDFGRSKVASSHDRKTIRDYLDERLDAHVELSFGDLAHPAVAVQVEQLRSRLEGFAKWQASWGASGKKILHAEIAFEQRQVALDVDGIPFYLHGRIDRIDRDEATGQLFVFDYKVPNRARTPDADHLAKGDWKNLQLPLYRQLVAVPYPGSKVELGYISLPAEDSGVRELMADWSEADLMTATDVAKQVVRDLRNEVFWPPAPEPPRFSEDLAPICQDGRLGAAPEAYGEEA
jgi:hypothetical protein